MKADYLMKQKTKYINAIITKFRYDELMKVLFEFKGNYAIVKGNILSLYAYDKPFERISSDIDILINITDIKELTKILEKNGFVSNVTSRESKIISYIYSHQIPSYSKKVNGLSVEIDINYSLVWGEADFNIDINNFLSDCTTIGVFNHPIKTLTKLKSMIQLMLHHYKDMNSIYLLATRKSIKYDMFKDVYYLWKNNQNDISLDKLYAISSEYEIIPYVFYILYYTNQIYKDDELENYVNAFRTPEGEALLNCYGLCDKERKEWKYDFQTRLETDNLYDLIKDDLTEKDKEKIKINKRIFMGVSE